MKTVDIKRSQAAEIIEEIRLVLAKTEADTSKNESLLRNLSEVFESHGIHALKECDGEAHSNPFIDNCGCCAPRWGFTGTFVRVR